MHYLVRSFLVWLLFIPAAVLNGALRDLLLTPVLGDIPGRAVSSVSLSLLIFLITALFAGRLGVDTRAGHVVVGAFWLVLTLLFEFAFGILVVGHPMDELLQDFALFRGRLWPLVLASVFFSPLLAGRLRRRNSGPV